MVRTGLYRIGVGVMLLNKKNEVFVGKRNGSRESDLKGALDNPNQELDEKNKENSKKEDVVNDFQLSRALDLVRGISLYKNKLAIN